MGLDILFRIEHCKDLGEWNDEDVGMVRDHRLDTTAEPP